MMFQKLLNENLLYTISLFLIFISSVFYCFFAVMRRPVLRLIGKILLAAGAFFLLGSIVIRTVDAKRLPFASMYEFGILMILTLYILTLILELKSSGKLYAVFLAPVTFILSGIILLFFQEAKPLMPALKSAWLVSHVMTAVLSYGFLAASFAAGIAWHLVKKIGTKNILPSCDDLERFVQRMILVAFPLLTLLIITGAVWAEYAWGSWWRWDPKETWALITWLVYLFWLHGVKIRKWKGKWAINLAIIAFIVVLFTFFGVNLLMKGLHSYA